MGQRTTRRFSRKGTNVVVSFLERDTFRDGGRMEAFLGKALDVLRDLAVSVPPDAGDSPAK